MFGDYVFLDVPERRRFAAADHEYLIEQLQIAPPQSVAAGAPNANVDLAFNHCCKEFIWVIRRDSALAAHEWFNYSSGPYNSLLSTDLLESAIIRLDGYDRFYRRNARYFRLTQPYQCHTAVPNNFIYLYSFSLKPEAEQPTGSINCSKIDDITLNLKFNPAHTAEARTISVFATNYNILRIVGGLGGVAFIA